MRRRWRRLRRYQVPLQQRALNAAANKQPAGHKKALISLKGMILVVIYMHTMHAWLTVQMLWQMHGRTLQAVHMLIVCMGIFSDILK